MKKKIVFVLVGLIMILFTAKSALSAVSINEISTSEYNITTTKYSILIKNGTIKEYYSSLDDWANDYVRSDTAGVVLASILELDGTATWVINEGQSVNCDTSGVHINCSRDTAMNNFTFYEDYVMLDSIESARVYRVYHYTGGSWTGSTDDEVFYYGNDYKSDSTQSGWTSRTNLDGVMAYTNSTFDYGLFIQWDESVVDFGYELRSASGQNYRTFAIGRLANIPANNMLKQYLRVYKKNESASSDDQFYSINNCFKENPSNSCLPPVGVNDTSLNISYIDCSLHGGNCQGMTEAVNESFNFSIEIDSESNMRSFFYFNITDRADLNKVHFKVDNANGSRFEYSKINPVYSYDHDTWSLVSDYELLGNDLHFNQSFSESDVEIASWIPYTYQDLVNFVNEYNGTTNLNISVYGKSELGNNLYRFDISNYSTSGLGYVLISRQHPAESYPSFSVEEAIKWLLSANETAQKIRSRYNFYIYPMLNPDGVAEGNDRDSNSDSELNNEWGDGIEDRSVEVNETYLDLQTINDSFDVFLDWHSSKQFYPYFLVVENSTTDNDYKTNMTILASSMRNWTMFQVEDTTDYSAYDLAYRIMYTEFGKLALTLESSTANNSVTEAMHREQGIRHIRMIDTYFCSFIDCTENTTSSSSGGGGYKRYNIDNIEYKISDWWIWVTDNLNSFYQVSLKDKIIVVVNSLGRFFKIKLYLPNSMQVFESRHFEKLNWLIVVESGRLVGVHLWLLLSLSLLYLRYENII